MNFYKHHIGDYDQATRHLSFVEDAAYSRLIRKYYAEEKVLPGDVKKIERLIGARTKEEREAVSTVLEEFFVLEADGWHNKRCDEELAKANAQAEANRKIALAREAKKRERLEHEQTTNRGNSDSTNRTANDHESWSASEHESLQSREPSQTPDSRLQTPDSTSQTPDLKPDPLGAVIAGGITPRSASDESTPKNAADWLRYFREHHGVELDATSLHDRKKAWPLFTAWANAGVSIAQMDAAVAKAQAEAKGAIAFLPGYADAVLASMSRPASSQRLNPDEHRRAISDANAAAWLAGGTDPNVIDMES